MSTEYEAVKLRLTWAAALQQAMTPDQAASRLPVWMFLVNSGVIARSRLDESRRIVIYILSLSM